MFLFSFSTQPRNQPAQSLPPLFPPSRAGLLFPALAHCSRPACAVAPARPFLFRAQRLRPQHRGPAGALARSPLLGLHHRTSRPLPRCRWPCASVASRVSRPRASPFFPHCPAGPARQLPRAFSSSTPLRRWPRPSASRPVPFLFFPSAFHSSPADGATATASHRATWKAAGWKAIAVPRSLPSTP